MTEAEARTLLCDWPGVGGLEAWIAGRRWRLKPGGWIVTGELEGWRVMRSVAARSPELLAYLTALAVCDIVAIVVRLWWWHP